MRGAIASQPTNAQKICVAAVPTAGQPDGAKGWKAAALTCGSVNSYRRLSPQTWSGAFAYRRLADRGYQRVVMVLLLASSLGLIWTTW